MSGARRTVEESTGKATGATSSPARQYNGRSKKEYEDEGLQQAIEFFRQSESFKGGRKSAADVRQAIDDLPHDRVLKATMADFWLSLDKGEARARRNDAPPPSPFRKEGRNVVAEKGAIEVWDLQWRAKLATEAAMRIVASSGASSSRKKVDVLRVALPWLMAQDMVVGCAGDLPQELLRAAMAQPQMLGMQLMTIEQALRKNWVDVSERGTWVDRVQVAYSKKVDELARLCLLQQKEQREKELPAGPRRPRP